MSFDVMKEGQIAVALKIYVQLPEVLANHPISRNTVYRVHARTQDDVIIA